MKPDSDSDPFTVKHIVGKKHCLHFQIYWEFTLKHIVGKEKTLLAFANLLGIRYDVLINLPVSCCTKQKTGPVALTSSSEQF